MCSVSIKPRKSIAYARKSRVLELDRVSGIESDNISPQESIDNTKITLSNQFIDYLTNSSLHGLKYVGDLTVTYWERFFFLLSFLIVTVMSGYFISNVWEKWSVSPVIISLNPKATSLKDIPFPAVTICNMNQAKKSVAKLIQKDTVAYSLLQSLCADGGEINSFPSGYQGKWAAFKSFLQTVIEPCKNLIVKCTFAGIVRNCSSMFKSVPTDEGICCSFNGLADQFMFQNTQSSNTLELAEIDNLAVDWTPENGFPPDVAHDAYPQPIPGMGSTLGLTVILDARVYDYYCSSTNGAGFKILLHNPIETPKIADYGFSVATGKETRVAFTPRISDASSLIRRIPKDLRQCIFANEGNLSVYRTYSKKNCEMECVSQLLEKACGCVLYYMHRNTEDTIICSLKDAPCYENISLQIDLSNNDSYSCKCLPGCFEIGYIREISAAPLTDGTFEINDQTLGKYDPQYIKENLAVLHFYVVESSFRSFTKGELIGFTEFLSNTGGLLGLFMGFSVLSLIEIIYFLTLRTYCLRRKDAKKRDISANTVAILHRPNHEEVVRPEISRRINLGRLISMRVDAKIPKVRYGKQFGLANIKPGYPYYE